MERNEGGGVKRGRERKVYSEYLAARAASIAQPTIREVFHCQVSLNQGADTETKGLHD